MRRKNVGKINSKSSLESSDGAVPAGHYFWRKTEQEHYGDGDVAECCECRPF